jgi:hypothetical protein
MVALAFPKRKPLLFSAQKNDSDLHWLNQLESGRGNQSKSQRPPRDPNRNRRLGIILLVGALLILCVGVFGLVLYRARALIQPDTNATAQANRTPVNCQELIDRAMQSSGDSCNGISSNQVCYGNNTLTAELNPGNSMSFAQRGDVIDVEQLKRLAASPLNLLNNEWGVAVFKIMANLPRSLPGETVTMVVFGNTTLDNPSSNLQSFYFSSTLGQIECDQVPFDGLMITMPEGAGVRFVINGADMALMGNASLSASQNGSMNVSMYSGSAIISANGETQLVLAGESTSMDLGGPNGNSAISPPSVPVALSPEELALACTLTGKFCSQAEITPVSPGDVLGTLQVQMGLITPGPAISPLTPSPSVTPSFSPSPSPSVTTSQTASLTRTMTSTSTPSRTPTTTATRTRTGTPTRTVTGTLSITPTRTATSTGTPSLTATYTSTPTLINTTTQIATSTSTNVATSTATATFTLMPSPTTSPCSLINSGPLSSSGDQLSMSIQNNSGGSITIQTVNANWDNVTTPSQKISESRLGGTLINSSVYNNPPVTISSWIASTDIGNGQNPTLLFQFSDALTPGNSITVNFSNGCQVQGNN